MSLFIRLLFFSLLFSSFAALYEVINFAIRTNTDDKSPSVNEISLTLWFNFTVYECNVTPLLANTVYRCYKDQHPQFTVLGTSQCHKPKDNNTPEAKIMIENDSDNGVKIATISFEISSGTTYGIEKAICVGNRPNHVDCALTKRILHFDTSKPGDFITNPIVTDGTNVNIELNTCEPTADPTASPLSLLTNDPTTSPLNLLTSDPTASPLHLLTNDPTVSPLHLRTSDPTASPLNLFTNDPSSFPTKQPLNDPKGPTQHPSNPATNDLLAVAPTSPPTFIREQVVDEARSTTSDNIVSSDAPRSHSNDILRQLALIAASLGFFLCLLFVVGFWWQTNKENQRKMERHISTSMADDDAIFVKSWIENTLQLPMYLDIFIKHGYNSFDKLCEIADVSQLNDIGITRKEHQRIILREIAKLHTGSGISPGEDNKPPNNAPSPYIFNPSPYLLPHFIDATFVVNIPSSSAMQMGGAAPGGEHNQTIAGDVDGNQTNAGEGGEKATIGIDADDDVILVTHGETAGNEVTAGIMLQEDEFIVEADDEVMVSEQMTKGYNECFEISGK